MKIRLEGQRVGTLEYDSQVSIELIEEVLQRLQSIWPTIQELLVNAQYMREHTDVTENYGYSIGVLKSVIKRLGNH